MCVYIIMYNINLGMPLVYAHISLCFHQPSPHGFPLCSLQMAVHLKDQLQSKQPLVQRILQRLMTLIKHPEARSQDNESATDNAVSAVRPMLVLYHRIDVDDNAVGAACSVYAGVRVGLVVYRGCRRFCWL